MQKTCRNVKKTRLFKLILMALLILVGIGLILKTIKNERDQENTKIQNTTPFATQTFQPQKKLNKVIKVIDGDTIVIEIENKHETVRLIGIDAPETVDPRKTIQCFGKEASNKAKEMLNNKSVFLEADSTQGERDKYQRLLRYVFLQDRTNFNKLMIEQGYAHEYTYKSNPYKYQKGFKKAEKEARENKKGLWAENACAM